ncbi:hypothetical protein ASC66_09905 [Leifsonia sp. Root4]|uniref:hypothetical protein n=1 Tax=Leifsonia sp. Root4 TaxID=1736525 RepID=UPI0006F506C5|nr:hypothetical protein [Leifsonia sp. Root4]KQW05334.1 hypothetical protein ASC66_09905 [Leifsonia sp. Root4]
MSLARHIQDTVNRYWAEDVRVLGTWEEGPATACVVYRRTIDPTVTLGRELRFHVGDADGTIEGYARDVALNLAEPIGALSSGMRKDEHGIVWVAFPEEHPTPQPPVEVIQILAGT